MFNFDPTITLGAILSILGSLSSVGVFSLIAFTKLGGRIDLMAQRLGQVEDSLKNTQGVNERLGRIETRMDLQSQLLVTCQKQISHLDRVASWHAGQRPQPDKD